MTDHRARPWLPGLVTGLGVLVADQVTKSWAVSALDDGRIIDLIGSLRFRLVHNTGAAFSQGEGLGPVFAVLVVAVIVVLIRFGARLPDPSARVAVGAVIGGAVGNLADRLVRSGDGVFGGAVVDFVDLQWWPVFNVADMAVVVGGAAIVWISRHDPGSAATS